MKPFHIYLYGPSRDGVVANEHHGVASPQTPASETGPFQTSFEQASQRLEVIDGISLEPDGSFGFVADAGKERLFGMLYDAGDRLQYVDLQAELSFDHWRKIVEAVCGPGEVLATLTVLQLPDRSLKTFQQFETETWGTK